MKIVRKEVAADSHFFVLQINLYKKVLSIFLKYISFKKDIKIKKIKQEF